jgi:hypothetical protein
VAFAPHEPFAVAPVAEPAAAATTTASQWVTPAPGTEAASPADVAKTWVLPPVAGAAALPATTSSGWVPAKAP